MYCLQENAFQTDISTNMSDMSTKVIAQIVQEPETLQVEPDVTLVVEPEPTESAQTIHEIANAIEPEPTEALQSEPEENDDMYYQENADRSTSTSTPSEKNCKNKYNKLDISMITNTNFYEKQSRQTPVETKKNNNNKQDETILYQLPLLEESDLNQSTVLGTILQEKTSEDAGNKSIQQDMSIIKKFVLYKLRFTILRFSANEKKELKILIESMGGFVNEFNDDDEIYPLNKPADYLLVPLIAQLNSSTITKQVSPSSTVTLFWLKHCIENNFEFEINENVLYQPIPRQVMKTCRPLKGCLTTISGYDDFEREKISIICQLEGSVTQFCFTDNNGEDYLFKQCICKIPDGPIYKFAKAKNIPTVAVEWLVDSCVSGVKANENEYLIDSGNKYEDLKKKLDRIRRYLPEHDSVTSCSSYLKLPEHADNQALELNTPERGRNYDETLLKSDRNLKDFEYRLNLNVEVDKEVEILHTSNFNCGSPVTTLDKVVTNSLKQKNNDEGNTTNPLDVMQVILKDVSVYVCKKLAKNQPELTNIVEALGGDIIKVYKRSCTHVICSGKEKIKNNILESAVKHNKIIVTPEWIFACQEQQQRVDEKLYMYDPKQGVDVTSQSPSLSIANENQVTGTHLAQSLPEIENKNWFCMIKNYCSDEDSDDDHM